MVRSRRTTVTNVGDEELTLYEHRMSGIRFAVNEGIEGDLKYFIPDLDILPKGEHLNVLADVRIKTARKFTNYWLQPICPTQVESLFELVKETTGLEEPTIEISLDLFKVAYGLEKKG